MYFLLARNDFITATYIIFLGILPTLGLILLGVWYRRNNPNKQWKKGALSKYVFNVDCCFKPKRKSCATTISPVYKSQKEGLFQRILVALMPNKNPPQNTNKIFSISDQLSNKEKLEIVKSNLVSTTNPNMINSSNNIQYRNSLNEPKVEFSHQQPTMKIDVNSNSNSMEVTSKRISPLKIDLGSKLADHIQQFQKGSNRNFKGLKVQTELKFGQLNESPCSTSGTTPNSSETLLKDKSNLTSKAPFYNKKPPPPPK